MKKLIIAAGTGFLGTILIEYFKPRVQKIIVLTRSTPKNTNGVHYVHWNAKTLGPWVSELEHADVLINMTGRTVDCRYTSVNKEVILKSRIESTVVLNKAILQSKNPPKIWLNSSTATIYKHSLDKEMDETSGVYGTGFSETVAQKWETAFFDNKTEGIRKVALRTAIVLGKNGGALQPMINLTKFGIGGKQGNGNQKFSWIHELDFARSIAFIIAHPKIKGPVNIVAPQPTTNAQLMQHLQKTLNIQFALPISKFLLKIGAIIIRTETELVLKSRYVVPKKLLDYGYKFTHPQLQPALTDLLSKHLVHDDHQTTFDSECDNKKSL